MQERISIALNIRDQALSKQLSSAIAESAFLFLSEENVPYLEEIVVTDDCGTLVHLGEMVILVGKTSRNDLYAQVKAEKDGVIRAMKRAVLSWETARSNRQSAEALKLHKGSLHKLAENISYALCNADEGSHLCKALIHELPIGMLVVDHDGYVSMLNKKGQEFFQGADVKPASRLASIVLPDSFNEFLDGQKPEAVVDSERGQLKLRKFCVNDHAGRKLQVIIFHD
jgi:hypothetical protein